MLRLTAMAEYPLNNAVEMVFVNQSGARGIASNQRRRPWSGLATCCPPEHASALSERWRALRGPLEPVGSDRALAGALGALAASYPMIRTDAGKSLAVECRPVSVPAERPMAGQ